MPIIADHGCVFVVLTKILNSNRSGTLVISAGNLRIMAKDSAGYTGTDKIRTIQ